MESPNSSKTFRDVLHGHRQVKNVLSPTSHDVVMDTGRIHAH